MEPHGSRPSDDVQQKTVSTPQPAVCNGPTVEIS
ncbi:hypothetical protein ACTXQV_72050, partial [Klebsiella pneumoniae]